ncbi:MAG TPA: Gfo/Idh/MocA family oxidoreductase [Candidatus Hydrogenedentes bacterium]|nr:Gfo/Idh/MocA family oxidoreductase [Candidatus Hydrogenedentota bacterium]
MAKPSTRFCLVGVGRAGMVHARNVTRRIMNAEMTALCDANPDALKQAGDELGVTALYTDYREAVADPCVDAVIIVTPTFLHCPIACAAAARKKHVFLEKPMAITVAECRAINEAASQNGVKLQLGFMRRFSEGFLRAKAILDSGDMGRIMIIKSTGRGPGLPPPWIYDIGKSNGILAEVNSHDFDSVRWLAGSDIVRVYAEGANFKCPDAKSDFPDFYDNALVSLRFANGTIGSIDGTCPAHYGYDARVEVLCERGALFIGSTVKPGFSKVTVDDVTVTGKGTVYGDAVQSWRDLFKDAYVAELEHFIACLERDESPSVSGQDGLQAVAAVVAANRSIQSGEPVTVTT